MIKKYNIPPLHSIFLGLILPILVLGLTGCLNSSIKGESTASMGQKNHSNNKLKIYFEITPSEIRPGESATLKWSVEGRFFEVFLGDNLSGNKKVTNRGEKKVYPKKTTVYFLRIDTGDRIVERTVRATVTTSSTVTMMPLDETEGWVQTNGPYGGGIDTIEINPKDHDTLYAGGQGGLFITRDRGEHWKLIRKAKYIANIIIHPKQPEVIYILGMFDVPEVGFSIYKSSDGGKTWKRLTFPTEGINCMTMLREKPWTLFVGTGSFGLPGKIYRSDDSGITWQDISGNLPTDLISDIKASSKNEIWVGTANRRNGKLYHTTNGGLSWREVNIGKPPETDIISIFVDPDDSNVVYVGVTNVHNAPQENEHYLFKTEDGGTTWNYIKLNLPTPVIIGRVHGDKNFYVASGFTLFRTQDGKRWTRIQPPGQNGDFYDLAVDPLNHNVIYLARRGYGILKSENAGGNGGTSWKDWKIINNGLLNTTIMLIALPHQPGSSEVYASTSGGEGIFKTTDYGKSWVNLIERGEYSIHPWGDELKIPPYDSDTVWFIADVGKIYISHNGGKSWRMSVNPRRGGRGFRYSSVYSIAPAPSQNDTIYALKMGFGIFKTTDLGNSWHFLHQSEIDYTYSMAVHPTNPDIIYSGYNPKPFQDWAMVRKSENGGETWQTVLKVPHSRGITSVIIDPNNPDTVYAGSTGDRGSLWRSRDGGKHWRIVNPFLNFTNVHIFTTDPNNSNVAYAGVWGGGTYKTTDSGKTWRRLLNDPTISASAIMVSPRDSKVIYLADRTAPRIYKTENGGKSWKLVFDAGKGYYRVLNATIAPSNPNTVYASVFTLRGPMSGHLFRITENKSTDITANLPRIPVAIGVNPKNENIIYAVIHGYGVFKTLNGGKHWVEISGEKSGLPQNPQVGFLNIVIDPRNTQTLYLIGGSDIDTNLKARGANPAVMNTVYKSVDGGKSWRNLNDGHLGENSGTIKGLAISPYDPNTLYIGGLKGIFVSRDGGKTWSDAGEELPYKLTAGVGVSSDGFTLYVPTLGGGVYRGEIRGNRIGWEKTSTLTVPIYNIQVAVDPKDSKTLFASAYPGGLFKSVDGGTTWSENNFGMASFKIDDPNRQGYYAFAIAPSNHNTLYLGLYGVGVYKSTDGANTWRPINGANRIMRKKPITSLLIDPQNEDRVYIATEDGIYLTTNGGNHWRDFSRGLITRQIRSLAITTNGQLLCGSLGYGLYEYSFEEKRWKQLNAFDEFGLLWPIWDNRPLYQYTSLLFHPKDPNTIYIGTFPAGIYKSTDGGKTWYERNVGWTNDGVFTLTFHPKDTNTIYAGTYNGLNISTDAGNHWKMWDRGWPDEQWVFSIDFDPRNPRVMYACSKNGENEGLGREGFHGTVMKSTDGGANWFPITEGLNLDQEFYKIIVDRKKPDIIYLATQNEGVFVSPDGGTHWKPWNRGLTELHPGTNGNNVTNVMELTADGRYLFFGSAGSGVFRRRTLGSLSP